ncbi:MAG: cupredoxin domain-containing protein [Chloroflexi bacterium]|nr:cupredoxin domain-containing protein [Chloroflexota bacterium]
MSDERRRRKRGHRRGGGDGHPSDRPTEEGQTEAIEEGQTEERPEEGEPQSTEESGSPSRRRFFFGRRRDREGEAEEKAERGHGEREERQAAGTAAHVSPLSFWRRGRSRTYREQPMPKQTLGRTLRRVRGMYLPPWVPVMFIIFVVFAILGVLFFVRGATGAPRINDHWHATYQTFICGQRQPHFPTWEAGVHTHADGIIHMHPFTPREEGSGARLVKWFEYGGGKLTQSVLRKPGSREEFKNGDLCEDGREGFVQVFVNGEKLDNWGRYIPQDGDRVRIVFGPEEAAGPVEQEDRTVIPESEAARTVEIEVTGAEGDAAFVPDSIEIGPGETVRLLVRNTGSISHSVRVEGADGVYETSDDFVSEPEIIQPGEEGFLIVRLDEEGEFEFKDPTAPLAIGTIVVTDEPTGETPEAGEEEPVDVTFDVSMGDHFFEPSELEVEAGQTFRINLTNDGEYIHNLHMTGADGEYDTGDDLMSTPKFQKAGETGELVGRLDTPGVYSFHSDSQSTEMTGTITVK